MVYRIIDEVEEIQYFPVQMSMRTLIEFRQRYDLYPPFQRGEVWPPKYKDEYLDSHVNGYLVPDILLTPTPYDPNSKWVIDGQQRLRTLLEFYDAHMAMKAGKPLPTDEEGKPYHYFPITERQEERFLNRIVTFKEMIVVSPRVLTTIFLRLQNQVPLTTAEKLWASPSKVNDIGKLICRNSFFSEIYSGKTSRKQPFQMSIYPVMAEMFSLFADMSSTRLKLIVRGSRDDLVRPEMAETIDRRLVHVSKLFQGVQAAAMTELIIMYQCVWLLDFIGADFDLMEVGALTPWYQRVEQLNADSRAKGFMNLFAQMTNHKVQKEWWSRWIEEIVYNPMEPVKFSSEEKRLEGEAQMQRFTGWLRHNGICPYCHYKHVRLEDVKKHIFRPADMERGPVDAESNSLANCKNSPIIVTRKKQLALAGVAK